MSAFAYDHRPLLWIAIGLWGLAAVHYAIAMRRLGRRWWAWFIISMLCSIVPAAIVSILDYRRIARQRRELLASVRRCPHCGSVLTHPDKPRRLAGRCVCDHCNMVLPEGNDLA